MNLCGLQRDREEGADCARSREWLRGSEILGSFGKEASRFLFAELYRVSAMQARGNETAGLARQVIAPNQLLCFEGQRLFSKPYASPVR